MSSVKTILLLYISLFSYLLVGQIDADLQKAIVRNNLEGVKKALEGGADINSTDENGANPLMWSVYKSDVDLVKYLVKEGAIPPTKGVIFTKKKKKKYYGSLTSVAAGEKKIQILKYLIEKLQIPVDQKGYNIKRDTTDGWTALQWAESKKNRKIVNYLIQQQADTPVIATELSQMYQDGGGNGGGGNGGGGNGGGGNGGGGNGGGGKRNQYKRDLGILKAAQQQVLQENGNQSLPYAKLLEDIGKLNRRWGQYEKAELSHLQALEIYELVIGKEHSDYAAALNNLASLYQKMGKLNKCEALFKQALDIQQKNQGKDHPDYAIALSNLAEFYRKTGKYGKGERLFKEALTLQEKIVGKEHPTYANLLNNMAKLYKKIGKYELSESLHQEALQIYEQLEGSDKASYAATINYLAGLYRLMGKYEKSEALYKTSKNIIEELFGKEHIDYANLLHNMAHLYQTMGEYELAELLYIESKELRAINIGKDHPSYATSLNNLASLYQEMDKYEEAEVLFKEARITRANLFGENHPSYATSLDNLAVLYKKMEKYEIAESLHEEARGIRALVVGTKHPDYARSLNNLALLYIATEQYEQAENLLQEALSIQTSTLDEEHPDYASTLTYLATLYHVTGHPEKAEQYLLDFFPLKKQLIKRAFSFLSESEKQKYLERNFRDDQAKIHAYALEYAGEDFQNLQYDLALFSKGLQLNTSLATKMFIFQQADTSILIDYYELLGTQRSLAIEYEKPIKKRKDVRKLQAQKENLEKRLARASATFRDELTLNDITYLSIQNTLKKEEAAIEFVHFKSVNSAGVASIQYAAAVLLSDAEYVQYIPLFEEKQLGESLKNSGTSRKADYVEGLYSMENRGLRTKQKKINLYDLIWAPLDSLLVDINTIYYSSSGLLHRLNLAAIAVDEDTNLADHYQMINLFSTRTLAIHKEEALNGNTAFVVGGVNYDSLALQTIKNQYKDSLLQEDIKLDTMNRGGIGETWEYLRWTKKESKAISNLLASKNYEVTYATDAQATEESVKTLGIKAQSPSIIHLATHGFFFADVTDTLQVNTDMLIFKTSEHSMLRSGLLLAGANRFWSGAEQLSKQEDGVLTAMDISNMNLSNTDLVVLSACETGLGKIQGSEGVYGLQRAFKKAGADYLIMSLWQVPDRETSVFMTTFYKNWLEKELSIPEAFNKTQTEMRDRFFNPFQWAGFILIR